MTQENKLGFHCNQLQNLEKVIIENGLKRGEFFNFPKKDLLELKRLILSHNLMMSIHSPLVQLNWYPNPPTFSFLCNVDKNDRNLTMKMITETMSYVEEFGAQYVVVHYPTQASDSSGESFVKLERIALKSADWLAELSFKRNIPIHIEGVMSCPFLTVEFLTHIFEEYPHIRYCFDTGHMNLASIKSKFDLYEFAEGIAPYVGSIHLWNTRGAEDYLNYRHIPVHPSQNPEEGWANIQRVLEILAKHTFSIIFESPPYYPEALGNHSYQEGIKWVKEILKTLS